MATKKAKKPKNLIPSHKKTVHYGKNNHWKMDKASTDEYDDVSDYAKEHPEYVFQATEKPKEGQKYTNKYVGIHDPNFLKQLGAVAYSNAKHGGTVVRVGERKVK